MNKVWLLALLIVIALLLISPAQLQGQASNGAVTDLGSLAQLGSIAYAVSAKGDVVVGWSTSSTGCWQENPCNVPIRWTQADGMQELDTAGIGRGHGVANGISADGNVIVGDYASPSCPTGGCVFWWTSTLGYQLLPAPNGWTSPTATGVSKDGSVLVGRADQMYTTHAWRWTSSSSFVDLGTLPGSCCGASALAVSEDGTVVVGMSSDANMHNHAFRWTQAKRMQDLGLLPGGSWSVATGASTNGSVVVGYADTNVNCPPYIAGPCQVPFRWTKAAGMVGLPMLTDKGYSAATGVSADGKTVVGYAGGNCCDWVAWRWTAATSMQSISDWLADVGVNATAFTFYSAYAVTANGDGVVGQLTTGDAYLALATSNKTGMPTFSPKPGKYQGSVTVTLSHTSPDASIYYTTDGTTPTKNSTPYTSPIQVSVTTTIKAIAIVPSYPQSAVATGKYTIK